MLCATACAACGPGSRWPGSLRNAATSAATRLCRGFRSSRCWNGPTRTTAARGDGRREIPGWWRRPPTSIGTRSIVCCARAVADCRRGHPDQALGRTPQPSSAGQETACGPANPGLGRPASPAYGEVAHVGLRPRRNAPVETVAPVNSACCSAVCGSPVPHLVGAAFGEPPRQAVLRIAPAPFNGENPGLGRRPLPPHRPTRACQFGRGAGGPGASAGRQSTPPCERAAEACRAGHRSTVCSASAARKRPRRAVEPRNGRRGDGAPDAPKADPVKIGSAASGRRFWGENT